MEKLNLKELNIEELRNTQGGWGFTIGIPILFRFNIQVDDTTGKITDLEFSILSPKTLGIKF